MSILKQADQWLSNGILCTGRVSLFAHLGKTAVGLRSKGLIYRGVLMEESVSIYMTMHWIICSLRCQNIVFSFKRWWSKEKKTDTVEPRLTTTMLIRPPCYYGHFILARKKPQSVIFLFKKPFNTSIPLISPVFHGPKTCGCINGVPLYLPAIGKCCGLQTKEQLN